MVLGYDYSNQKRWQWRTNLAQLRATLMATRMHWSNTERIVQFSMSRATPEATGRCHQVNTRSVSPQWLPGKQQTKQRYKMCPLCWPLAAAVHRYYTAGIAWWRRFVAFIKATKRPHRASTRSNRLQLDMPTPILGVYFIVKLLEKGSSCPNNNRGMKHQSDEKHQNNMSQNYVGVVDIAFNRYTTWLPLCVINQ